MTTTITKKCIKLVTTRQQYHKYGSSHNSFSNSNKNNNNNDKNYNKNIQKLKLKIKIKIFYK